VPFIIEILVHPFTELQKPSIIDPNGQVQPAPVKPEEHPVHTVVDVQVLQPAI
jgi:hypothetical protein